MRGPSMNVKPIRNDDDHARALERIQAIADVDTKEACEEFDVLGTLIDAYEREHHPIGPPDPIEAIKFYIDQKRFTRKDLKRVMGTRARVSEILSGKRTLTLAMIRKLHEEWSIPL